MFGCAVLMGVAALAPAAVSRFSLHSPDLRPGKPIAQAQVLDGFGCKGGNESPALLWSHAPAGTQSFAVTFYDPDAPTGSGWWHWVIFDIPASAGGLAANAGNLAAHAAPQGSVQSRTDFGRPGYGGPCPPEGDKPHRYRYTLYALKLERLPVDAEASAAMVAYYLNQNALGKATLEVRYGR